MGLLVHAAVAVALASLLARGSSADDTGASIRSRIELIDKADPDECFTMAGARTTTPPCRFPSTEKRNQGYVFAMSDVPNGNGSVIYTTSANNLCTAFGGTTALLAGGGGGGGGSSGGSVLRVDGAVCEFGRSAFRRSNGGVPAAMGDWRPPKVFVYDAAAKARLDVTPDVGGRRTTGWRALGVSEEGVAVLLGPDLSAGFTSADEGALHAVALDALDGGRVLAFAELPRYNNARKFVRASDGGLYAGVRETVGGAGHVLKFAGSRADPLGFEVVGVVDSMPAELAEHDGRLFLTTWPRSLDVETKLYMSPPLPLAPRDAGGFAAVWAAGDYDPDAGVARAHMGGALASFDGALYWSTSHVLPFQPMQAHWRFTGRPAGSAFGSTYTNTQRALAVFRGRDLGTPNATAEVLYGERELPAFDGGRWRPERTGMGAPVYGASGFGDSFNAYLWTMQAADGKLFLGTMNMNYIARELRRYGLPVAGSALRSSSKGADLYAFLDGDSPAVAVSRDGLSNGRNYGIRTMAATADGALFLGTANPFNTAADGGYELLRVVPAARSSSSS